ncbi:polysaccharide deacetylase family protein [Methanogenium sp. S4BF]|uniref:polysaccharide deacetylase family protein n=1 Tax=Methanogenium sp. S4BF TaxID=1789226 RepID=UPI002417EE6E|nr:polysaccharide deacetylase family protein [Methanogenium sp. S4BF]WFN35329.1 polysaccharide deacetylase family protein [Methanogenium sp. S4BF]
MEENYGAKSSFYFLALKPGDKDYSYDILDLKDEIRNIPGRGWEVGLHGGHTAYNSYERICEEKKRLEDALGSDVVGYRNHYLHFRVPDTWEYLSHAGFMYDTTFGYGDCVGFRNGMCHPFLPYNLESKKYVGIVEIPLIVMETSLLDPYMRLDTEAALKVVRCLIDSTAECRGVFTLLWHNDSLVDDLPEQMMYRKILEYCSDKGAWMTSGEDIAKWWKSNG